ncbi:MAG TPA: tetratricopeptide repeat protein [Chthoniobacterales bacterium]|nr:tetratricopeptide repeat protein [Chthoniobacterales bacterium]
MAGNNGASGSGKLVFGICILLAVLTWMVFGQTLGHEFINYDDPDYVGKNAEIAKGLTLHGIAWAFMHIHSGNWHPLTTITHMLDCQLYGLKAGGHHCTNVVLHMLGVVLLFLVLREMMGGPSSPREESVPLADRTGNIWRSAFVAALFAIHPLHVESVAWVAERKDVLSGVFFMLTLAAYLRYVRRPSLASYSLVAFVFALGLLSKPMLVTLPFVLLLLDYWPLGRFMAQASATSNPASFHWVDRQSTVRRLILEKFPLLLLSAASSAVTFVIQRQAMSSMEVLPVWVRVYQAFVSCVSYIYHMFWPSRVALFYPYPLGALSIWPLALALVVLVAVTASAFKLRGQRPYFIIGWLWYLIMLVPVIGIIQVGGQARADRYTYLPHIGLYLLVTWAASDLLAPWRHRREILAIGAATAILVLAWCAWVQTSYWKNSELLWSHTLAVTRNNPVAHNNLGKALDRNGRLSEAIFHYRKAVELWPGYADGQYSLGMALFREGEIDEAIASLQKTLFIRPDNAHAHARLGDALLRKQRSGDAVAHYEKSLKIAPRSPETLNSLAWVLSTCSDAQLRNGSRAIQLAEQANQLSGGKNPVLIRTLAAAYAESGRFNDAIDAAQRASQLAVAKGNSALASQLRMDIDFYRMNFSRR